MPGNHAQLYPTEPNLTSLPARRFFLLSPHILTRI
jgi:hypothetical protein